MNPTPWMRPLLAPQPNDFPTIPGLELEPASGPQAREGLSLLVSSLAAPSQQAFVDTCRAAGWSVSDLHGDRLSLQAPLSDLPRVRSTLKDLGFVFADHLTLPPSQPKVWRLRGGRSLALDARPLIMAIVNVTPDSFYDGGRHARVEEALEYAVQAVQDGADILDIGGESTRPGALAVPDDEQLQRVLPVVEALSGRFPDVPISVDTTSAAVALRVLEAGASIINDVSGLKGDEAMASVVASQKAGLVLMHMRGTPRDMQLDTSYASLLGEVFTFLGQQLHLAVSAGLPAEHVVVDPGIGFGKSPIANLVLLKGAATFACLGRPVLMGASRKSFLGRLMGYAPEERLEGSLASVGAAMMAGVGLLRVHDVKETRRFADTLWQVLRAPNDETCLEKVAQEGSF